MPRASSLDDPSFLRSEAENHLSLAASRIPSPPPSWSLARDVFWERYGSSTLKDVQWKSLRYVRAMHNQHAQLGRSSSGSVFDRRSEDSLFFCSSLEYLEPWTFRSHSRGRDLHWRSTRGANRPRLLFQYKPYRLQDPLRLSEDDVAAVLEAVFGECSESQGGYSEGVSDGVLSGASDIASVILVKLVMDMYLQNGPVVAFPLVVHMLRSPLLHGSPGARARVFDLIANLAIHGELLYEVPGNEIDVDDDDDELLKALMPSSENHEGESDAWRQTVRHAVRSTLATEARGRFDRMKDSSNVDSQFRSGAERLGRGLAGNNVEEDVDVSEEDGVAWPPLPRDLPPELIAKPNDRHTLRFREWLRLVLFSLMSVLASVSSSSSSGKGDSDLDDALEPLSDVVQTPNNLACSAAWAAAMSCLSMLVSHEGYVVRSFVEGIPLDAIAAMYEHALAEEWSEELQCWLANVLANLFYTSTRRDEESDDLPPSHSMRNETVLHARSLSAISPTASSRYPSPRVGNDGDRRHRTKRTSVESSMHDKQQRASVSVYGHHSHVHSLSSSIIDVDGMLTGKQIDHDRIASVGGVERIAEWYLRSPTELARRGFFCILYDFITSCGDDTAIPPAQLPHWSDILSLGTFLLHARVSEPLHVLLRLDGLGTEISLGASSMSPSFRSSIDAVRRTSHPLVSDLIDCLMADLNGFQELSPSVVGEALGPFLMACLSSMARAVNAGCGMPTELLPHLRVTLSELSQLSDSEGLSSRQRESGAAFRSGARCRNMALDGGGRSESGSNSIAWKAFVAVTRDRSSYGGVMSESWMFRMMVAMAHHKIPVWLRSASRRNFCWKGSSLSLLPQPDDPQKSSLSRLRNREKNGSNTAEELNALHNWPCGEEALVKALEITLCGPLENACATAKSLSGALVMVGKYLRVYCMEIADSLRDLALFDLEIVPSEIHLAAVITIDTARTAVSWLERLLPSTVPVDATQVSIEGRRSLCDMLSAFVALSETVAAAVMVRCVDPSAVHDAQRAAAAPPPRPRNSHLRSSDHETYNVHQASGTSETAAQMTESLLEDEALDQQLVGEGDEEPSDQIDSSKSTAEERSASHASPLSKVLPPIPRFAAAWRRLTSPHGSRGPRHQEETPIKNSKSLKANRNSTENVRKHHPMASVAGSNAATVATDASADPKDGGSSVGYTRPLSAGARESLMESATTPMRFSAAMPHSIDKTTEEHIHESLPEGHGGYSSPNGKGGESPLRNETFARFRAPYERGYASAPHSLDSAYVPMESSDGGGKAHDSIASAHHGMGFLAHRHQMSKTTHKTSHGVVSLKELALHRASLAQNNTNATERKVLNLLAYSEMHVGTIRSFLKLSRGDAVPMELLKMIPPDFLRKLFESLNPLLLSNDAHGANSPSGHIPGSDMDAENKSHNGFQFGSHGQCIEQYEESIRVRMRLWDARVAVLALLLAGMRLLEKKGADQTKMTNGGGQEAGSDARTSTEDDESGEVLDARFITLLLSDEDLRIRRLTSLYGLCSLSMRQPRLYRSALRHVVSRVQRSGEGRALRTPEAQLSAMLESKLISVDMFVEHRGN